MEAVVLPELGEQITEATVACWHVQVGDQVKRDDDIVELVTDKASFQVPSESDGVIDAICFEEGKRVKIGATLALIRP